MVIGEDVSRWELYFQNLNIPQLGMCVENRERSQKAMGEGGATLLLPRPGLPRRGQTTGVIIATEPSLLLDLDDDLFPSSPCNQTPPDNSFPREMETKGFCNTQA